MYKNIGILRNLWLGDSIVFTPFLRKLRKLYPDAKITIYVGTGKVSADFFERLPYIDEVISVDAEANIFEKLLFAIKNFRKHDLFVDTFESTKMGGMFANILGRKTVGFSHSGYHTFNFDTSSIDKNISIIKKEFFLFEKLWLSNLLEEDYSLDFPLQEADFESCISKLKDANIFARKYVCIHPSSDIRYSSRKFEIEKLNFIVKYLLSKWLHVVIIGTAKDAQVINQIIQHEDVIKLHTVGMNIWETGVVIKNTELFLGINSWPGWIATALRTKSIILNGPSLVQWEHPESMFPFVKSIRWWHKQGDCYNNPCDAFECKCNKGNIGLCMENISVGRIVGAINHFL